jgi:hypothetical protein
MSKQRQRERAMKELIRAARVAYGVLKNLDADMVVGDPGDRFPIRVGQVRTDLFAAMAVAEGHVKYR